MYSHVSLCFVAAHVIQNLHLHVSYIVEICLPVLFKSSLENCNEETSVSRELLMTGTFQKVF
jgi:hypothetical protein